MKKKRRSKNAKGQSVYRDTKTGKFIGQNPSKGSVWSGLSKRKTVSMERNLRGVMKDGRGEYLSEELLRYKGIKIIED